MRILVSNDDGYFSPGVAALAEALQPFGEIIVVAPEQNRSGSSNSLTLDRPLSVRTAPNGFRYVNGTPTDCVHIALTGLLDEKPDIVVSGINDGPNMGDDTIYSGTVAAAMEGYLFGVPSFAFSLAKKDLTYLETAARVAHEIIGRYISHSFDRTSGDGETPQLLLNVNIPSLPYDELKGFACTRLGKRHQSEPVFKLTSPRGETIYWIGQAGGARDAGPGTDFHAVANSQVSVTPLQIDLTHVKQIDPVSEWLRK